MQCLSTLLKCAVAEFEDYLTLYTVFIVEGEQVIYTLGEVKISETERKFEGLEGFHEFWVDSVSVGGACPLARGEDPLAWN